MNYTLTIALLAAGLFVSNALADTPTCKRTSEKDVQGACKQSPDTARKPPPGSGVSDADREKLERARTRHLLENIESELRRQRLGN